MKKIVLLILLITISISGLEIEDNTTKGGSTSTPKKDAKEEGGRSNATTVTDVAVQHPPKDDGTASSPKKDDGTASKKEEIEAPLKQEDYIMPKADDEGRVLVIPGIEYATSFSSKVGSLSIVSVDFEYNTFLMNKNLAIYGNLGMGAIDQYFLFHIEGGAKYNIPRLTRFLKSFFRLGVTINPYFTSDKAFIPIAGSIGVGFKFFITPNFAFEESQDFQIGNQLNNSTLYLSLRFKLGVIFIF
jgi:hypothetical protein